MYNHRLFLVKIVIAVDAVKILGSRAVGRIQDSKKDYFTSEEIFDLFTSMIVFDHRPFLLPIL